MFSLRRLLPLRLSRSARLAELHCAQLETERDQLRGHCHRLEAERDESWQRFEELSAVHHDLETARDRLERERDELAEHCRRLSAEVEAGHAREQKLRTDFNNLSRWLSEFSPQQTVQRMRADWEDRARTNPWYFTASGNENWTRDAYFATGETNIAQYILSDLANITRGADPKQLRILELGCGAGRMTRALARVFGEVHAIDLSSEMVRLCRENTADCPNVYVHQNNGMDLAPVHHLEFDFALSFIVFQHIPSKEIVEGYIREVRRVLKPGCLFKFQIQGVFTEGYDPTDTWHGAGYTEAELEAIAARTGFELRYSQGQNTQEYWLWFFASTTGLQTGHAHPHP